MKDSTFVRDVCLVQHFLAANNVNALWQADALTFCTNIACPYALARDGVDADGLLLTSGENDFATLSMYL